MHLAAPASLQALYSNNHKQVLQIKHNMIRNLKRQEADQLAIYKRVREVELGTTEKQIQPVVRAVLELPGDLRIAITTR